MLTQYEEKMTKTVENLEGEYATIRAGRANPNILNKIKVEYYGVPTPMQQLANITVPEARTLMIAPWEPSLVKAIEKAILNSDLGLTPNNDGKNIILNFPELTEERRKEIVKVRMQKLLSVMSEEMQTMRSRRWRKPEISQRMN